MKSEELDALEALERAASSGPWRPCKHLRSAESDAECPCGFPGDVWAGDGERVLFTMGPRPCVDGPELTPATPGRAETITNAQLIIELRNAAPALITCARRCAELEAAPRQAVATDNFGSVYACAPGPGASMFDVLLRKAKADGLREAARIADEVALENERVNGPIMANRIHRALLTKASEVERG